MSAKGIKSMSCVNVKTSIIYTRVLRLEFYDNLYHRQDLQDKSPSVIRKNSVNLVNPVSFSTFNFQLLI